MPNYRVRIKVYDVWVAAEDEDKAISAVYGMQTAEIAESGKLIDASTDHAEIMEVDE